MAEPLTQDNVPDSVEITENMGEWFVRVVRAGKAHIFSFEVGESFGTIAVKAADVILFANGPSRVACDAAARMFVFIGLYATSKAVEWRISP